MATILIQPDSEGRQRAWMVMASPPWRLGPFTGHEVESLGNLLLDVDQMAVLAVLLRTASPGASQLLCRLAHDTRTRGLLADECFAAADELYALDEPWGPADDGDMAVIRFAGVDASDLDGVPAGRGAP